MSRRARVVTAWWECGGVVVMALLILGACFCLFDGDVAHHDQGDDVGRDLCCGMIVATLTVPLLVGLWLTGRVDPGPFSVVHATFSHLPDPPPKPTRLA